MESVDLKNSDEAILERRKEEKKHFLFKYFNFSYLNYFERQHRDKIKEKYYSDEEIGIQN